MTVEQLRAELDKQDHAWHEAEAGHDRLRAVNAELLGACVAALEVIERHIPGTVFAPRERLRAAIAKATGS